MLRLTIIKHSSVLDDSLFRSVHYFPLNVVGVDPEHVRATMDSANTSLPVEYGKLSSAQPDQWITLPTEFRAWVIGLGYRQLPPVNNNPNMAIIGFS